MAKTKKAKIKIHEVTPENDIKFKGIFSYRHLRIFAWIALAIGSLGIVLGAYASVEKGEGIGIASQVLGAFTSIMTPLFLIAAFSRVISVKESYRNLMILYIGGAILVFGGFAFAYEYYIVGLLVTFTGDGTVSRTAIESMIDLISHQGFLTFNVLVDLALCVLMIFFINYRPQKFFKGKLIYVFRLLALLPIFYEIASMVFKILSSQAILDIPPIIFPLFTTKPPLSFFIFVAVALFMKLRERHFIKQGKTYKDYAEFLETRTNRWQVAKFLIICITIASVIDFLLYVFLTVGLTISKPIAEAGFDATLMESANEVQSWGISMTMPMILIVPILFFFDYKKDYKNKTIDIFIPVGGIILVAFVYFEGFFEFIKYYFTQMKDSVKDDSSEPEAILIKGFSKAIEYIKDQFIR